MAIKNRAGSCGCCGCDLFDVSNLLALKPGTLTTRTDDTIGVLTMASGHGVQTGDTIDIRWVGGSRSGVVVGTVATNSVPISLGDGGVLPVVNTRITVLRRHSGTLQVQTGASTGVLSLQDGHELSPADRVTMEWTGGSRSDILLTRSAPSGTLTTRTSDSVGTLTMSSGHNIVTGEILHLFWASDSKIRISVIAGTVATNSVPISLGFGDVLPATSTTINAERKNAFTISEGSGGNVPLSGTSVICSQPQSHTVSGIDGFVAYDKSLEVPGLWQLILIPKFTGDLNTTPAPKTTFRLLKEDNSVFAEWFYSNQIVSRSPAKDSVFASEVTWNGVAVVNDTIHIRRVLAFSTTRINALFRTHSIVMRNAYASIQNTATSGTFDVAIDTIEGFFIDAPWTAWLDEDEDAQNNLYKAGASLPFSDALATSTGPLRLAVKSEPGTDNSFALRAKAGKIRQEEIICDATYYEAAETVQVEENTDCILPFICRVTHPHYMTPMWEVVSATSDVSLASTEISTIISANCVTQNRHGAIVTLANIVPANGLYSYVDQLNYNSADIGLRFVFGASTSLIYTSLVCWEYDGVGDELLAASYTNGTGPTFRTSNFPFIVDTVIIATDNPCSLKVQSTFSIESWHPNPQSATMHASGLKTRNGLFKYPPNPQTFDLDAGTESTVNYRYNATAIAVFERIVPSWLHEPPTINFTSADMVSVPVVWKIMTGFSSSTLFDANPVRYEGVFSLVDLDTESIAFTLRSRTSPRVPHP